MAVITNNPNLELIKWSRGRIDRAFLRRSRFDAYTGTAPGSIIRVIKDLQNDGKYIVVPLIDQLRSDGVGTGQLTGREEGIDNYGYPMWPAWVRNAVEIQRSTAKESAIKIRDYITPSLADWVTRIRRDDMIKTLLSIPTAAEQPMRNADPSNRVNGLTWASASAGQRNSWATANSDRVVFGSKNSNTVAGNVAASLLNVTAGTDKMSGAVGNLLKSTASLTTLMGNWPAIKPWMIEDTDEEWYVCFLGSRAFRDFVADPVIQNVDIMARPREKGNVEKDNPIFAGSHRVYNGVIYREIPEIDAVYIGNSAAPGPLYGAGAGGVDVSPIFMCGSSAYAYVIGQMPRPTHRDETDYQFLNAYGTEMQYGYGKIAKGPYNAAGAVGNLKDWGVVTGFVASAPNA